MIAAATAPWWQLILMTLVLIGLLSFLISEVVIGFCVFLRWIGKMVRPSTYQQMNVFVQPEHKDPTRPRSWEDEMEAKYVVADRMRALEKTIKH